MIATAELVGNTIERASSSFGQGIVNSNLRVGVAALAKPRISQILYAQIKHSNLSI